MAFRAIDHVQLAIPPGGEEQARAFYVEILGLQEVPKPSELAARGGAWFRGDGAVLHLGVDHNFCPATRAHPALRSDSLEALRERLVSRGVAVVAADPVEGRAHFYVADPFGNRLEFIDDARSA